MKIKKFGALVAAGALALTMGLAGCGSTTTSGSAADSAAEEETVAVDGASSYALVEDGKLTVGTSAEYAPFEYIDDNGDYAGFDLELIQLIGDKLGLEVEFANVDFDTIVAGVASGSKFDVGIGAITITDKREKEVDFSDSYYMDDQAIVTAVGDDSITGDNYSEALNSSDIKLIVQSGSTAQAFAEENFPEAEIVTYKNGMECFSALQSGQGNAVITNRSVAAQMVGDTYADTCQIIKMISTGEEYGIAINKGNTKLEEDINSALAELEADGTIESLMNKYNING